MRLLTSFVALILVAIAACGGGEGAGLSSRGESPDTTSSQTGDSQFADSESACQLVTEEQILDLTSAVSVSRWLSSDETSCLYGMISPIGFEIVTISVAIPAEFEAFDLVVECARSAWGEESLLELEGVGENAFGIELPTGGALVHFTSGDVILGVGVMSSLRASDEAFATAREIARIADGVVTSNDMALADGRKWPPPGCG